MGDGRVLLAIPILIVNIVIGNIEICNPLITIILSKEEVGGQEILRLILIWICFHHYLLFL